MADNELYRQEIIIEVNDNDASEKVNKFEQKFKRSTDRMSKMAQSLGRQKIEPMMQARDKLTASVVKADRLVKKLDAAHASPIIAAQDKVSSVVTRVNAMIDAINRKDAKVVAEMKGPLMDELVQAKKAVTDLGDVKTGPVAELKGELFSQLSKAQGMMRNVDRMAARPRISVWDRATGTIRNIDSSLRSLTSKTWSIGVKIAGNALNTVKNIAGSIGRTITSPLALMGAGVGAAGAIAGGVVKPLELAGDMEQSRIAFETMLGSAENADKFLRNMQKFAATTPFEFPELQENAKLMLAFGFSTEKVMPMLETVGDTAAGLGAGSEGIQRMTRALGQMQAKGRAQTEELMQLQELGVPVNQILQEELGLTSEQVANIGKEGIAASKVIDAVLRGMDKRFGGLMDKQSRSLKGLWSTIKDTFNMNVLLKWGDGIRRSVEPRLQSLVDWFGKNEKKIEEWGNKLEQIAGEASDWVMKKLEGTFRWLDTNFFSNEEFMQLDFKGKVSFVWDTIKDEFDAWYQSSGKDIVAGWGEKIGAGIGAGLMALAGIDITKEMSPEEIKENPFVEAGSSAAQAFLKGFSDNFDFDKFMQSKLGKWGTIIAAGFTGAKIGGLPGAAISAGSFGTYAATRDQETTWEDFVMPALLVAGLAPGGVKAGKAIAKGGKAITGLFKGGKTVSTAAQTATKIATATEPAVKAASTATKSTSILGPRGEVLKTVTKSADDVAKVATEASKIAKPLSKVTKSLGKIAVPIGLAGSAASIALSEDKSRAVGQEVGGWGGALAGAAAGASLGSIVPGIGTAIGGIVGGIAGGLGGDWLGGKVVDLGRNLFGKKSTESIRETSEKVKDLSRQTETAQINTDRMNNQMQRLYGTSDQLAGSFPKVGESATTSSEVAKTGMDSMANAVNDTMNSIVYIGESTAEKLKNPAFAAGYNLGNGVTSGVYTAYSQSNPIVRWILNTVAGGKSVAASVADINRRDIQTSRLYGTPGHAAGVIATKPHLAMVSEEGPEAIIPLSRARRSRALRLWQETGRYLGVEGYAEGGYTAVPVAVATSQAGAMVNIYMNGLIGSVQVNNAGDIQEVANMAASVVAQQLTEVLENKVS